MTQELYKGVILNEGKSKERVQARKWNGMEVGYWIRRRENKMWGNMGLSR